jgi:hypothetical protein
MINSCRNKKKRNGQ